MSTAPLAPTARTCRLCGPTVMPSTECGDVHGVKSAPSSEHWKSNTGWPVSSTSPVNVNIAVVAVVSSSGPRSIDVSGADRSTTVKIRFAAVGSTLPVSSTARTSKLCSPAARTSTRYGVPGTVGVLSTESQSPSSAPSSRHSYSSSMSGTWSSVPVNSNPTSQLAVRLGGPLTMRVSGGVVSGGSTTSHSYGAGTIGLGRPSGPSACTWKVWLPVSSFVYVFGEKHSSPGRPASEHWTCVSGWSTTNSNVAVPVSAISGGPEMIDAIGPVPEPSATAKSVESSISSAHTIPVSGLFVSVTSMNALPSHWSSRADAIDPGVYGTHSLIG